MKFAGQIFVFGWFQKLKNAAWRESAQSELKHVKTNSMLWAVKFVNFLKVLFPEELLNWQKNGFNDELSEKVSILR